MVRPCTLSLALVLASGLAAQRIETRTVHFALASAEISPTEEAALRALCDRADIAELKRITLIGHTDTRGSIAYNEDLSHRRAEAVKAVLASTCLRDIAVDTDWEGELVPIALGNSESMHAANRRVEIELGFSDAHAEFMELLHRHPRVTPLMPAADLPRELFTVDPSQPIEFVASDGVRVRIAANAIVDEQGNAAQGPVDISYRSFNDAWAMIASGIPMHVGHGDDAGHMESMGMYEIYASQRGESLSLRDGETISLTKTTAEARTPAYRDWMLDEATGTWSESNTATVDATAEAATGSLASSAACVRYLNGLKRMPALPDSTRFLQRLASPYYCHTTACSPASAPYAREGDRIVSPYRDKDIPSIEVHVLRDVYKGRRITGLRITMENEKQHTEWRAFPKDRIWAYNGPLNRRKLTEQYSRKHFYQDIFLEVNEDGMSGTLRLKDRGRWVELPLDLSFHQQGKSDAQRFREELATYTARFEAKRARFDRRLNESLASIQTRIKETRDDAWKDARRVMLDNELAMTAQEFDTYAWGSYAAQLQQWQQQGSEASKAVTTSFAMRGFGIYNCDQILQREAVQPQEVAVLDADGNYFPWHTAYGVLGSRKSVITYWGDGTGTAHEMRLSSDMTQLLFVATDGTLLMVEQPGAVLRRGKVVLTGKPMEQPESPKALEALAQR